MKNSFSRKHMKVKTGLGAAQQVSCSTKSLNPTRISDYKVPHRRKSFRSVQQSEFEKGPRVVSSSEQSNLNASVHNLNPSVLLSLGSQSSSIWSTASANIHSFYSNQRHDQVKEKTGSDKRWHIKEEREDEDAEQESPPRPNNVSCFGKLRSCLRPQNRSSSFEKDFAALVRLTQLRPEFDINDSVKDAPASQSLRKNQSQTKIFLGKAFLLSLMLTSAFLGAFIAGGVAFTPIVTINSSASDAVSVVPLTELNANLNALMRSTVATSLAASLPINPQQNKVGNLVIPAYIVQAPLLVLSTNAEAQMDLNITKIKIRSNYSSLDADLNTTSGPSVLALSSTVTKPSFFQVLRRRIEEKDSVESPPSSQIAQKPPTAASFFLSVYGIFKALATRFAWIFDYTTMDSRSYPVDEETDNFVANLMRVWHGSDLDAYLDTFNRNKTLSDDLLKTITTLVDHCYSPSCVASGVLARSVTIIISSVLPVEVEFCSQGCPVYGIAKLTDFKSHPSLQKTLLVPIGRAVPIENYKQGVLSHRNLEITVLIPKLLYQVLKPYRLCDSQKMQMLINLESIKIHTLSGTLLRPPVALPPFYGPCNIEF